MVVQTLRLEHRGCELPVSGVSKVVKKKQPERIRVPEPNKQSGV